MEKASLQRFETAVFAKDYNQALHELFSILNKLEQEVLLLNHIEFHYPIQFDQDERKKYHYFATRWVELVTQLFTDPDFQITDQTALNLFCFHKSIEAIFGASAYLNSDHILRRFDVNQNIYPFDVELPDDGATILKFATLYGLECNIRLNLDILWNFNPNLCACVCLALICTRFVALPESFQKRHEILQWLPQKLLQIQDVDKLPSAILHDVYMHCSYDISANKHDVKKGLNYIFRKQLTNLGWQDFTAEKLAKVNGKPVMFAVMEWFSGGHSIYRTHSTSLIACKEHFHLVGITVGDTVDEKGLAVFDEAFSFSSDKGIIQILNQIRKLAEHYCPAVLYMPSLGMQLYTIYLSVTRIAPIQLMALGHPATSHSLNIDYVVVEEDYVGKEECFSETLIKLPKDALPYVPSAHFQRKIEYKLKENPEVVNIGVAASIMKINPYFLQACQEIIKRAKVKVHFHIISPLSAGLMHVYLENTLRTYLGESVTAYAQKPYEEYLELLSHCDMLINPFPFGNTNGIVDMVSIGLVGICKTGDEVHEHIDEGLFRRLGLPEWLICKTVDEYIDRVVYLAEHHEERLAMRRDIIENNKLDTLFSGNPKHLGLRLIEKVKDLKQSYQDVEAGFTFAE